jgi:glycerol-3-phosphate acyltransferase PlsY
MTSLLAVAGYVLGGFPTADFIARSRGVDLRLSGSGNPGANNALRLGGRSLAAMVLIVEIVKGGLAVWAGRKLGADAGAVAAGLGAIAGNVWNPYFRGKGGKGLAITAGVTIGAWPPFFPVGVLVLVTSLVLTRASGTATLMTISAYMAGSFLWIKGGWSTGWGIAPGIPLLVLAIGVVALLAPKALADARSPMPPPAKTD